MLKYLFFACIICLTMACANSDKKSSSDKPKRETVSVDGAKIFKQSCSLCHGLDGKLGANGSKDLTQSTLDLNERIAMVSKGKGVMMAFENILNLSEIKAVSEYTMTLKAE